MKTRGLRGRPVKPATPKRQLLSDRLTVPPVLRRIRNQGRKR